jgi:uncharacterized protein
MHGESNKQNRQAFESWTRDLACPVCHGSLSFQETSVACSSCARVYPVVDGIPVLIPDRSSIPPKTL